MTREYLEDVVRLLSSPASIGPSNRCLNPGLGRKVSVSNDCTDVSKAERVPLANRARTSVMGILIQCRAGKDNVQLSVNFLKI